MRFPAAEWKGDGLSGGSFVVSAPKRLIFHTTETEGVPSYGGGASAPHLTYYVQRRRWVQHSSLDHAARALRNAPGGVETNRQGSIQVELVCYSDKSVADKKSSRLWVGNLPQYAYDDLAEFAAWCIVELGVTNVVRLPRPTPKYGAGSPARMTPLEWNVFNGFAGHFEVPENTHWDPGAFDFERLVVLVADILDPYKDIPFWDDVSSWAKSAWKRAYDAGLVKSNTQPGARMTKEEFFVFLERLGVI